MSAREPGTRRTSRRDFFRVGGIALGGIAVGGAATASIAALTGEPEPTSTQVPGFEHIVVLMGENRSFDNMLGHLYTPDTVPDGDTFEGLAFGDYSNTAPDGTVIPAHVYEGATDRIMCSPDPDPGETYPHVNTQLFGTIDPPENANAWQHGMAAPFNAPEVGAKATMSGFVQDYLVNYRIVKRGAEPSAEELAVAMGGFAPPMLPVLSTLAREFAVFDNWFAAVPSQTYCNRSFFNASTSHGFVTNGGEGGRGKWLDVPAYATIFNRLEDAGLSWKVYFDKLQLVSLTGMLHAPALEKYWRTGHFAHMEDFFHDAKHGTLPAYAFIEPRLVYNHNDFHPPHGRVREGDADGESVFDSAVSDVRAGEALVAAVYDAVRTSSSTHGSNARNTLLLITFDEHGGTYDHVPPPAATPQRPGDHPGEMGFRFDRLGVRVPAIAVSAYTKRGTIIHQETHHAAVIATLCRLHGLQPLTDRDRDAADLFPVVNLTKPRDPSTWPTLTPAYVPPLQDEDELADLHTSPRPLTSPAKGLLGLLLARYGDPDAPEPETYHDAYQVLVEHGHGLFGDPGEGTPTPAP